MEFDKNPRDWEGLQRGGDGIFVCHGDMENHGDVWSKKRDQCCSGRIGAKIGVLGQSHVEISRDSSREQRRRTINLLTSGRIKLHISGTSRSCGGCIRASKADRASWTSDDHSSRSGCYKRETCAGRVA
jgi:hypothetical protein